MVLRPLQKLCGNSSFVPTLVPFSLFCIFPYNQIKVDEPLLHATTNFWIPTQHVFHLNGVEIWPTLKEFSAIMGEPEVSTFPPLVGIFLP